MISAIVLPAPNTSRSSPHWRNATAKNSDVAAWQTDSEYFCHNTPLSYSPAALRAFRDWLARRYQSPDVLNRLGQCVLVDGLR
ncbi:MAG: beta-galactosidase [Cypionkella sp.]